MMNIYELAVEKMDAKDIDHHESDLYLRMNTISKNLVQNYDFRNLVTTFRDQIDNDPWYEIPFAYPIERDREREAKEMADWLTERAKKYQQSGITQP